MTSIKYQDRFDFVMKQKTYSSQNVVNIPKKEKTKSNVVCNEFRKKYHIQD